LPWAGGAAAGLLLLVLLLNWAGGGGAPADAEGSQAKTNAPAPREPKKKPEDGKPAGKELPRPPPSPIRDLPPGKVRRFLGHAAPVCYVTALEGGRKLLSVAVGEVMIWDANDERVELKKYQPLCLGVAALSPDGAQLLTGRQGQEVLFTFNLGTGASSKLFGTARGLQSLAISPDGGRALSAGFVDNLARLWDLSKQAEIRRFEGRAALFSHDALHVLTLHHGFGHGRLKWYRAADGDIVREFDEVKGGMLCVALSGDSSVALTGDGGKCLRVWDVASGKETRKIDAAHASEVLAVAFSPDGRRALSGSRDKAVKLWEIATGRELRKWYGHSAPVICVAFTPDGRYALSGSEDRTMRLWALPE
jgi:WD40 repeat protein